MKTKLLLVTALAVLCSFTARTQGITSGTLSGRVLDENREPLVGATIQAEHEASGTTYRTLRQLTKGIYKSLTLRKQKI